MPGSILGKEVNRVTIQEDNDYFLEHCIFKNREDAAKGLAYKLKLLIDKPENELIILLFLEVELLLEMEWHPVLELN